MEQKKSPPKYTAEFRERGVRLFQENRRNYSSDNAAIEAIAPKLGCSPDSLRIWYQQSERDAGARSGLSSADKDSLKALERENKGKHQRFNQAAFAASATRSAAFIMS